MNVLLDTHCWIWWLISPERLASRSINLLKNGENTVFLSAASSWEIAIKYALGKLPLPEHPKSFVPARLARDGFTPLAISHAHALHVASLPVHHRDPFDRILIAQSQLEQMPIMTIDAVFERYDVEVIWAASA